MQRASSSVIRLAKATRAILDFECIAGSTAAFLFDVAAKHVPMFRFACFNVVNARVYVKHSLFNACANVHAMRVLFQVVCGDMTAFTGNHFFRCKFHRSHS